MTREEAIKHLKLMQSGARNAIRFTKNDKEISEEERKEDIDKSDVNGLVQIGWSGDAIVTAIINDGISSFPAIPLDKVKQAREEIENIAWKTCTSRMVDGNRVRTELIDREDVLEILDKLIAESEESKCR